MHRVTALLTFLFLSAFLPAAAVSQDRSSGELVIVKCWTYDPGELKPSRVSADSFQIYLGGPGAKVDSLNAAGVKMWSTELGGEISSDLLPLESSLVLSTTASAPEGAKSSNSVLRSLSKETGVTIWSSTIPEAEQHYLYPFNGRIIVVSLSGSIQSLDAAAGSLVWKREIADGFTTRPVFNKSQVIIASTSNQLFTIALASGEIRAMQKTPYALTAIAEAANGEIIAGDERGNILSLSEGFEKPVWKFKSGGQVSAVLQAGSNTIAASHDNFIYSFNRNGNIAWKRRLAGRAAYLTIIPDRYAIVASTEDEGAAFIDLAGGKVAGQIVFGKEEVLAVTPLMINELIVVVTNHAAYGFSIASCAGKNEGGTAQSP